MNHTHLPSVASAQLPARYEAAKTAIAECFQIDECKDWSDKAQALASYARQSEDKEMEKHAMRIRARAISRCGELLKEIEKANGANQNITDGSGPKVQTRKDAATEAGLSERQAKQAIRVANIPKENFEALIESDSPPTITKLADMGKGKSTAVPVYEKQGMTKKEFQAGMYLAGALDDYLKECRAHDPADVVAGRTDDERESLRKSIEAVDQYHDQLIAKL